MADHGDIEYKDNLMVLSEFGYGKLLNFDDFINDSQYYKESNDFSLILDFDLSNVLNDSDIINIEFIYSIFDKLNNYENKLNQLTIILPAIYRSVYSILSSFSNIKFKALSTYKVDISNHGKIYSYSNSCIEQLLINYKCILTINSISNENKKNYEIEELLKLLLYKYHPILSIDYENNKSSFLFNNCNYKKKMICIYYFAKKNEDEDIICAAGILEDGQIIIYYKDPFGEYSQINIDDILLLLESCIYSCINYIIFIAPNVITSLFFILSQGDEKAEGIIQKIIKTQKYPFINRKDLDILKINKYTYTINKILENESCKPTHLFVLAGQSNMSGRGNEDDIYDHNLIKSQSFGTSNCSESIKISENYCRLSKNISKDKEINNFNGKLIYYDPITSWSQM